ncbi:bacterial regulatory s, gntR family protein [Mycobacterium xenopi 3993]|nr:bacterial regulatory s, gntR family protein [Mycobacterium xenopi 3993]
MARPEVLALALSPEKAFGAVRSPKTAEVVARRLRKMVVDGQLADGDFLPHEAELMAHFRVSRPTLREAVRILESERLIEVRRGSRTGARVRIPGPEIVARPAGLLLELSGATLADVMTARIAIEPAAAKLLAETGTEDAHNELRNIVNNIPAAWEGGELPRASANLHRRMVELSGNTTLGIIAGMLHEISERHTAAAVVGVDKGFQKPSTRDCCDPTDVLSIWSPHATVSGQKPIGVDTCRTPLLRFCGAMRKPRYATSWTEPRAVRQVGPCPERLLRGTVQA